jgi:hypothetical protein
MTFTLVPAIHAPHLLDRPLQWSLDLWGEGKEEFTAEDWHAFYARVQQSNYEIWNQATDNKELLFLAVDELNEVIATIGLCDFDDSVLLSCAKTSVVLALDPKFSIKWS